jgi:UDP-galactopyranose mutase
MKTIHVIGGGITGCFLAFFLKDKYHIKLYEKTGHLGGLSSTFYSIENIPYQKGFHILHTNQQWILNIIQRAGVNLQRVYYDVGINPLIDFNYYSFPFSDSVIDEMPWHWKEAIKQDISVLTGSAGSNLKEEVINFYGETIYEIFYKGWIEKLTFTNPELIDETSWFRKHLHPIDKNINYYKEDCYFPVEQGWNKLFAHLTKDAEVVYQEVSDEDFSQRDEIILTIRPDKFFKEETLKYVGINFEIDSALYNPKKPDTIIYPNDTPFISMSQYGKLFNPENQVDGKNIIVKEYTSINSGEDAYPIITKKNISAYKAYINTIRSGIHLCGPLAEYRHMSMADSIESAHRLAGELKHKV